MRIAGVAESLEGGLRRLAQVSHRHPLGTLAIAAFLSVFALLGARKVSLDTDLIALLPADFESVTALTEMEQRFGTVGYMAVLVEGGDPAARRRYADDLVPRLAAVPGIRYAEARRPTAWLADRALYFLDVSDLEAMRDRLKARVDFERRKANPLLIDVDEDEGTPPPLDFSDLVARHRQRLGFAREAADIATVDGPGTGAPAADDYYEDAATGRLVVLARPGRRATDLDFTAQVVNGVEAAVATLDTQAYATDLKVRTTGNFRKRLDQQAQITADVSAASIWALGLTLAFLVFHFRRLLAVVLVVTPLLVGLLWTVGLAGATFGTLNLMTGFIGAILLGLGVDHGIHLLGRYDAERARGRLSAAAIELTFGQTGRAVTAAVVTTLVAFLGVSLSAFRAFREFGLLAAAGMALVFVAYTTVLPALIRVLSRFERTPPAEAAAPLGPAARPSRSRRALPGLLGTAALAAIAAWHWPAVRFDTDFEALEDTRLPAHRLYEEVTHILGHSQSVLVLLTDSAADEAAAAAAVRAQKATLGADSGVDFVVSVADLLPEAQVAKQAVLAEIGAQVARIKPKRLSPAQRDRLARLKTMAEAIPFGRADLPVEVRRQFEGGAADAGVAGAGGLVLVYPSISLADGQRVRALARELRGADYTTRPIIAGEPMAMADILDLVVAEAPPVLAFTLGLVLLTLVVVLASIRRAVVCFVVALGTLLVTIGLLPAAGVPLNYLNIILVPVLFGVAVDGAVHLVTRMSDGDADAEGLEETRRAIGGAILTTALGFGALLVAEHPGLQSLARFALLGLGVNLLVCLVVLPAGLAWRLRVTAAAPAPVEARS